MNRTPRQLLQGKPDSLHCCLKLTSNQPPIRLILPPNTYLKSTLPCLCLLSPSESYHCSSLDYQSNISLVSLPPSFLYSKPNKQIWSYLLQEVLTDSQAFLIRPAAHTSPSPTLYIPTSHLLSEETNLLSVNPLSKPLSTYVPQDSILLVLYDQGKRSFCRVTLLSLDIMFCSVVSPSEIWVQREQVIGIRMARIKTDLAKTQVGAGKQDQSHRVWALNKTEHTHKQSLHLHL